MYNLNVKYEFTHEKLYKKCNVILKYKSNLTIMR